MRLSAPLAGSRALRVGRVSSSVARMRPVSRPPCLRCLGRLAAGPGELRPCLGYPPARAGGFFSGTLMAVHAKNFARTAAPAGGGMTPSVGTRVRVITPHVPDLDGLTGTIVMQLGGGRFEVRLDRQPIGQVGPITVLTAFDMEPL